MLCWQLKSRIGLLRAILQARFVNLVQVSSVHTETALTTIAGTSL